MYQTNASLKSKEIEDIIPKESFTLKLNTRKYAQYDDRGRLYGNDMSLAEIIGNHLNNKYENDEEIKSLYGAGGPIQVTDVYSNLLTSKTIKVKVTGTATIWNRIFNLSIELTRCYKHKNTLLYNFLRCE